MRRNSITEHLKALEDSVLAAPAIPAAPTPFTFGDGRYTIRVANDLESRRKAYGLVYRLYLEKEYAQPHPSKMWLSIFDALPETTTLLVERHDAVGSRQQAAGSETQSAAHGPKPADVLPTAYCLPPAPVGALTVVFDSPLGLPADELYKPELDALRAQGRRLSEIVSLGVAEDSGAGSEILVKLFNFVYLLSRKVRGATDFMITVNPRHVRFYEKTLLFAGAGPERECKKVGGAPALLLRLDLAIPEARVRLEHGPAETRPPRSRTLYPTFHAPAEEPDIVSGLSASLRPMTAGELGCFFVAETDILARAAPEQREFVRQRHTALALANRLSPASVRAV
jgi:hypothetical protein